MVHGDFTEGDEFICGDRRWRCTDVGRRTIVAVCLSAHPEDQSWFNGPPYAVEEHVFDENDLAACDPTATPGDEPASAPSWQGSTWHYQAYADASGQVWIYEDYCDENGVVTSRTEDAVSPTGEDISELIGDLRMMLHDAIKRPVKQLDA